ncbi:hypothetical protein CC78DRAFT_196736 [Lojkania enalia]|uniref:Uncharacterized protein n=1 Tax=Lojkania enalia TaxID=147567 RepID=A0A9P4TRA9_9PLEO|nr:hypothetical protein CC78DRAFT_196736 [Didymosphaeria enalia]
MTQRMLQYCSVVSIATNAIYLDYRVMVDNTDLLWKHIFHIPPVCKGACVCPFRFVYPPVPPSIVHSTTSPSVSLPYNLLLIDGASEPLPSLSSEHGNFPVIFELIRLRAASESLLASQFLATAMPWIPMTKKESALSAKDNQT